MSNVSVSFSKKIVKAAFVAVLMLTSITATADYYQQNPAPAYHSTTLQERAPVQVTGNKFPSGANWRMEMQPSINTYMVKFAGKIGKPASHEGEDYVHNNPAKKHVQVVAVAKGTVAYARTGCPQSSMFSRNTLLREAGAGWGNHVVLYHGNGIYTRYAHLAPGSIKHKVGDQVITGDILGEMGNTGRSEVRHLHFELGYKGTYFVASQPSQSFDLVFDPLKFAPLTNQVKRTTADSNNVRMGPSMAHEVIQILAKNVEVTVIDQDGQWLKIRYEVEQKYGHTGETHRYGWIHSSIVN